MTLTHTPSPSTRQSWSLPCLSKFPARSNQRVYPLKRSRRTWQSVDRKTSDTITAKRQPKFRQNNPEPLRDRYQPNNFNTNVRYSSCKTLRLRFDQWGLRFDLRCRDLAKRMPTCWRGPSARTTSLMLVELWLHARVCRHQNYLCDRLIELQEMNWKLNKKLIKFEKTK